MQFRHFCDKLSLHFKGLRLYSWFFRYSLTWLQAVAMYVFIIAKWWLFAFVICASHGLCILMVSLLDVRKTSCCTQLLYVSEWKWKMLLWQSLLLTEMLQVLIFICDGDLLFNWDTSTPLFQINRISTDNVCSKKMQCVGILNACYIYMIYPSLTMTSFFRQTRQW